MLKIISILACLFCLFQTLLYSADFSGGDINVSKAEEIIKKGDAIIVDVRTPGEFFSGHLKNSRNINFFGPRFDTEITELPKDKPILLYCKTGRRSEAAKKIMDDAGYTNVYNLMGGINAWQKTGKKIDK